MTRLVDTPQFKQGMSVEKWLDDYFASQGYTIRRTTPEQERRFCLGDRIFNSINLARPLYIEYKSGIQTFYTGNVFLETVSVDSQGKAGWVYTSKADYIFYAALLNGKILIFRPDRLRMAMAGLKAQFREVKTSHGQNQGYDTHGVIVPLAYAEKHLAEKIIDTGVLEVKK